MVVKGRTSIVVGRIDGVGLCQAVVAGSMRACQHRHRSNRGSRRSFPGAGFASAAGRGGWRGEGHALGQPSRDSRHRRRRRPRRRGGPAAAKGGPSATADPAGGSGGGGCRGSGLRGKLGLQLLQDLGVESPWQVLPNLRARNAVHLRPHRASELSLLCRCDSSWLKRTHLQSHSGFQPNSFKKHC